MRDFVRYELGGEYSFEFSEKPAYQFDGVMYRREGGKGLIGYMKDDLELPDKGKLFFGVENSNGEMMFLNIQPLEKGMVPLYNQLSLENGHTQEFRGEWRVFGGTAWDFMFVLKYAPGASDAISAMYSSRIDGADEAIDLLSQIPDKNLQQLTRQAKFPMPREGGNINMRFS